MDFLCGFGVGLLVEVCVACAWWVVEKAMRPICALRFEAGCMRGRRNVGRKSAMASVGLYMVAMVTVVACARRGSRYAMRSGARVTPGVR
jgi:hypothetical protein